jgi:hypothetical protein
MQTGSLGAPPQQLPAPSGPRPGRHVLDCEPRPPPGCRPRALAPRFHGLGAGFFAKKGIGPMGIAIGPIRLPLDHAIPLASIT